MKFNLLQPLSIMVWSFFGIILAISEYPVSATESSNPNHRIISRHTPELEGFNLHHPDISPDGEFIAFTASFNFGNIWVQEISTGKTWPVTKRDSTSAWGDVCPRWSPDGSKLFFTSDRGGEEVHVFIVNSDGSNLTQISDEAVSNGSAWDGIGNWMPDSKSVIYPILNKTEKSSTLVEYELDSQKNLILHSFPDREALWPNVSPNGKTIVYVNGENDGLELLDLDTKTTTPIVCDIDNPSQPRWSPNGEWIGFQRGGSRGWANYIIRSDGTSLHRISDPELDAQVPSFTSDGKSVVYHAREVVGYSLAVLDTETTEEMVLVDSVSMSEWYWGSWAPNNKFISFMDITAEGEDENYGYGSLRIVDLDGNFIARPTKIKTVNWNPAYKPPAWKSDSSGLYVIADRNGKLELAHVSVDDFSIEFLTDTGTDKHSIALSPDQELIAYVSGDKDTENIWIYDLYLRESYPATFSDGARKTMLSFSPDGTKVLFHKDNKETGMDIMVLNVETNIVSQQTNFPNFEYDAQWIDDTTIGFSGNTEDSGFGGRVWFQKALDQTTIDSIVGNKNGWVVTPIATNKGSIIYYQLNWPVGNFFSHDLSTNSVRQVSTRVHAPIVSQGETNFAFAKTVEEVFHEIRIENIEHLFSGRSFP